MRQDVLTRPDVFPDILSLVQTVAGRHASSIALIDDRNESVTYDALRNEIEDLGAVFRRFGITRSSRVAIVLPNGMKMAVSLLATTCAAIAVPLNPSYTKGEFNSYFADIGVTHLLIDGNPSSPARQVAVERGMPILEMSDARKLSHGAPASAASATAPAQPHEDDIALILLTSGSTGRPKKVPLSHRNICVSVADIVRTSKLTSYDACLCMWEQFHIGGLVDLLLAPIAAGGRVICTPGFNANDFFRLLQAQKPTWFQGVPATLYPLSIHANARRIAAASSLRFIRSVASALSPQLMKDIEELFGVPVTQTFGMTEAAPLITTNPLPPGERKPGSVGKSCGPDIRIQSEDGRLLDAGQIGEVVIRGPNVFSGYEDAPEANAQSFRDGWFRTGDTGYLDEGGYLYLCGRIKELINRGGEKIGPNEVEDALLKHPGIAQAAVFATPHKSLGEDVAAAVVLRAGFSLEVTTLRLFLFDLLAPFKIPQHIVFRERLPLNPVGKIDKLSLFRELAEANARPMSGPAGDGRPRHALDRFLIQTWCSELSLEPATVGIDDNFSSLGGDSLSSLQILHAAEEAFSMSIPNDMAITFITVRAMADGLAVLGVATDETNVARSRSVQIEARTPSPRSDADVDLKGDFVSEMRDKLRLAPNATVLRLVQQEVLALATPAELSELFPKESVFKRLPHNWQREQVGPNVWRYRETGSPGRSPKTVIVGFTGNARLLMLPTHLLLANFDPQKFEILLLRDPSRRHYEFGIEGIGESILDVCHYLKAFVDSNEYAAAVSLGTSGGALAAIAAAIENGWAGAISVAPDGVSRRPGIAAVLAGAIADADRIRKCVIQIAVSGGNDRDRLNAEEVARFLPNSELHRDDRFESHNLLYDLFKRGELPGFLMDRFAKIGVG